MKVSVQVEGLKELGEQLQKLSIETQAKVLRAGLRAAVQPIAEEARRLVPRGGSPEGLHLADAITVVAPKPTGARGAVAGIKMASKNVQIHDEELEGMFGGKSLRFKLPGWRWHFVEFGTPTTQARPYLRPAFDAKAQEAITVFRTFLAVRLEKIRRKASRDTAKAAK